MQDFIESFAGACSSAEVTPAAALVAGGLHRCTWFRWKAKKSSPTLRNIEAAHSGLNRLIAAKHGSNLDLVEAAA